MLKTQNLFALGLLGAFVVLAWWLLTHSGLNLSSPATLIESFTYLGSVGIFVYILMLALAIVVSPIPGTPITAIGGLIWGPWMAGIYGIIGIFTGSMIAYFIGRTLGRSTVQALTGKAIYLSKERGEVYLGWVMFVFHLFPVLPFDLMSYGAGISGMSLPVYAIATLLGTIPATFFLTYMGAAFKVGLPIALTMLAILVVLMVALPILMKRYRWLNLQDILKIE